MLFIMNTPIVLFIKYMEAGLAIRIQVKDMQWMRALQITLPEV